MNNLFNPAPGAAFDKEGKPTESQSVDTVVAEVLPPAEEGGPVTENVATPAEELQETKAAEEKSEIDWGTVLSERTGGKFKSWDEINTRLSEDRLSYTFANDDSKKVFDYLTEGKIDDVLQVYNEQRRLSSLKDMSDADVVQLWMEYKQAGYSPEDISDEYAAKYSIEKPEAPIADDYLDDDAFNKAQKVYEKDLRRYEKDSKALNRQLKQDAAEARDYLSSLKKDIVLPEIAPVAKEEGPTQEEIESATAERKKFREEYISSLDKSYNDFKEIPLRVNDEGVSFDGKFEITDAERNQLKQDLSEKNIIEDLFLSRYVKEDGYDTKQLMEDLYWLKNKERIVSSAVKQALSKGKLEKIKETKNIDLEQTNRGDFTPSKEVELKEFSKNFFKAG